jgi:hypothetical protein
MVRRRSTVRFCKGTPVQEINSNVLNLLGSHSGSQVVRTSGKISTAWAWSAFSALGLDYLGTVGSVFAEAEFRDLIIRLRSLEQSGPPFATCRPTSRGTSWPPRSPTPRSPRRTDPPSATPTPTETANPATRLPWIGWPAKTPRSAKALGYFAVMTLVFAVDCVSDALGPRHLYDVLGFASRADCLDHDGRLAGPAQPPCPTCRLMTGVLKPEV